MVGPVALSTSAVGDDERTSSNQKFAGYAMRQAPAPAGTVHVPAAGVARRTVGMA